MTSTGHSASRLTTYDDPAVKAAFPMAAVTERPSHRVSGARHALLASRRSRHSTRPGRPLKDVTKATAHSRALLGRP